MPTQPSPLSHFRGVQFLVNFRRFSFALHRRAHWTAIHHTLNMEKLPRTSKKKTEIVLDWYIFLLRIPKQYSLSLFKFTCWLCVFDNRKCWRAKMTRKPGKWNRMKATFKPLELLECDTCFCSPGWDGSDEWIRAQFKMYLMSLLSTIQHTGLSASRNSSL